VAEPKSNALQSAFNHLASASKTATTLIKTAVDAQLLDAIKEINQEIIAAQGSNIAAQQEHAAMLDDVRELKSQIAQFEDWEQEKTRYELKPMDTGVRVYVFKLVEGSSEPAHEACPKCFKQRQISILQPIGTASWTSPDGWFRKNHCPSCRSDFVYGFIKKAWSPDDRNDAERPRSKRPKVRRADPKAMETHLASTAKFYNTLSDFTSALLALQTEQWRPTTGLAGRTRPPAHDHRAETRPTPRHRPSQE